MRYTLLLAVCAALAASCGSGQDAASSSWSNDAVAPSNSTPATPRPTAVPTTSTTLPPGRPTTESLTSGVRWEGGFVSVDGLELTLIILGRPASPEGDPCTTRYAAQIREETTTAIAVRIVETSRATETTHTYPCPMGLAQHSLSVRLAAPLNGRLVEVLGEVRSLPMGDDA